MSIVQASIYYAPGQWWAAGGSLRSSRQAGVLGNVEEQFEGPIHHRIDVPRLDSFIHYQMIQAAIVFHRACLDLYSPEPAIPTILNQ